MYIFIVIIINQYYLNNLIYTLPNSCLTNIWIIIIFCRYNKFVNQFYKFVLEFTIYHHEMLIIIEYTFQFTFIYISDKFFSIFSIQLMFKAKLMFLIYLD